LHVHFFKQGHSALQTLGEKVGKGASSIVSFGGGVLAEVVSAGFDLILVFVLTAMMTVYLDDLRHVLTALAPHS